MDMGEELEGVVIWGVSLFIVLYLVTANKDVIGGWFKKWMAGMVDGTPVGDTLKAVQENVQNAPDYMFGTQEERDFNNDPTPWTQYVAPEEPNSFIPMADYNNTVDGDAITNAILKSNLF